MPGKKGDHHHRPSRECRWEVYLQKGRERVRLCSSSSNGEIRPFSSIRFLLVLVLFVLRCFHLLIDNAQYDTQGDSNSVELCTQVANEREGEGDSLQSIDITLGLSCCYCMAQGARADIREGRQTEGTKMRL